MDGNDKIVHISHGQTFNLTQKQGSMVNVRHFNLFISVSARSHHALGASIKPYTDFRNLTHS